MIESTPHPKVRWCNTFFPSLKNKSHALFIIWIWIIIWTPPLKLSFGRAPVLRKHLLTQAWMKMFLEWKMLTRELRKRKQSFVYCSCSLIFIKSLTFPSWLLASWGRIRFLLKSCSSFETPSKMTPAIIWSLEWLSFPRFLTEKGACCCEESFGCGLWCAENVFI